MTALGIDLEKTNERGEVVLVDPTPEIKTAVAADVADPESEVGQALSTAIGSVATPLIEAAVADIPTTFSKPPRVPSAPVMFMAPAVKTGITWAFSGASANANVNTGACTATSTEQVLLGANSVKVVTNGQGNVMAGATVSFASRNITGQDLRFWIYLTDNDIDIINVGVFDAIGGSISKSLYAALPATLTGTSIQAGRWNVVDVPMSGLTGTIDLTQITSMRVRVTDKSGMGATTFYLAGMAFTKRAHTGRFPNGVVSLTVDDSFGSQWSILRPALDAYGWRATLYPIIDQIDAPGNLTMAQVTSLHNDYGWEVGAHATTGAKHAQQLIGMTHEERVAELTALRAWQADHGFDGPTFAYPIGNHDKASEEDVALFYASGRQATMQHIIPQYPANFYGLDSANAGTQTSTIAERLTQTAAGSGWLIITIHAIKELADGTRTTNDITAAQLATLLTDIAASGCEVLPMADVIRSLA